MTSGASSRSSSTIYVVGHRHPDTDSICSAIAYAHLKNVLGDKNVVPARAGELDEETRFVLRRFGVAVPESIAGAAGRQLILVDHNEVAQALPGIARATILEIWEHHRLGDLRPPGPIFFHCEPVGATATLIAEQYFQRGVIPPPEIAGILLASILSDTMNLCSPTVSEKDRRFVSRLGPLAGVGPGFGEELLRVRIAAVERRSAADLVRRDYKELLLGRDRVGIGQVEVARRGALDARKDSLLDEMRALCEAEGLTQVILMITDVDERASDLLVVGDQRELVERAFGALRDDTVRVPGLMSRKKQLVPALERAFESEPRSRRESRSPRARLLRRPPRRAGA